MMKAVDQCKNEVATRYFKTGNTPYADWAEMEKHLLYLSKSRRAAIWLYKRLNEAIELYQSQLPTIGHAIEESYKLYPDSSGRIKSYANKTFRRKFMEGFEFATNDKPK